MTIMEKMRSEFAEYDHETKLMGSSSTVVGEHEVTTYRFSQGERRPPIEITVRRHVSTR